MSGNVAILSDIHGNAHALRAVLADLEQQPDITERVCLGDIVGYGAYPAECIAMIRSGGFTCIHGNHDAMIGDDGSRLDEMNPFARQAILWTQLHLNAEEKHWLAGLPLTFQGCDYEAVHASLHQPGTWPYVLHAEMAALHFLHQSKPVCFIGHTHRPAVWIEGESNDRDITGIESLHPGRRMLVNVGSVGQPRDKERKACYAIYRRAQRDICWRRVPYDVEAAQKGIMNAGLPAFFAARLASGK